MMPTDAELRRLVVERKVKDTLEVVSPYKLLCRIDNLLPTGVVPDIQYEYPGNYCENGKAYLLGDGRVKCETESETRVLTPEEFNERCWIYKVVF